MHSGIPSSRVSVLVEVADPISVLNDPQYQCHRQTCVIPFRPHQQK